MSARLSSGPVLTRLIARLPVLKRDSRAALAACVLASTAVLQAGPAAARTGVILPESVNVAILDGSELLLDCEAPHTHDVIAPPIGQCVRLGEPGIIPAWNFFAAYNQALVSRGWTPECVESEGTVVFRGEVQGNVMRLRFHSGWERWDDESGDYDVSSRGLFIFLVTSEDICAEIEFERRSRE